MAKAKAPSKKKSTKKPPEKKPRKVKDAQKKSMKQTVATGQKKAGGKSKHAANKAGSETGLPNAVAKKKRKPGKKFTHTAKESAEGAEALRALKAVRSIKAGVLRLRNKPDELHAHLTKLAGSTKAGGVSHDDLRMAAYDITGSAKPSMNKKDLAAHIHEHVTATAQKRKKRITTYPKTGAVREAIAEARRSAEGRGWVADANAFKAKAKLRRKAGRLGFSKANYALTNSHRGDLHYRINRRAGDRLGFSSERYKRKKGDPISVDTSWNPIGDRTLTPKRLNLILQRRGLSGKYTGVSAWKNSVGFRGGIVLKKKK